jgi:hypothetical protein
MAEEYYNIGPELSDIDFYGGGIRASSSSAIESSISAESLKIAFASSSVQVSLSNEVSAMKITDAQAQSSLSTSLSISGLEILSALVYVEITSGVDAESNKITFAQCSASISLTNNFIAQRISNISSITSISSSSSQNALKIGLATSSVNVNSNSGVSTALIGLINESLSFGVRLVVKPPIRLSPNYIDQTSIRTLVILDDKPLTNHNRKFDISLSPINTEVINWNNTRNRYYKRVSTSGRKTFSLNWTMLPNGMEDTVDQRNARDFLHTTAEDPDVHELKIVNQNESGLTPYTETTYQVFIRSYSENLVRRYISEGVYLYDCSLVLEEV